MKVTLYHSTTEDGFKGIQQSGKIYGPAFFTPSKETAQNYADGIIVEAIVNASELMVDFDLPGQKLLSVEEANGYSGNDGWTIEDYIRNGTNVATINNVMI